MPTNTIPRSAPVIDHWTRRRLSDPALDCAAIDWNDADLTTRCAPVQGNQWCGQLWERVAESAKAVS